MSYHVDLIAATKANGYFRQVLHTAPNSQLVAMCVQPGDDIGLETHHLDQVLVFVEGEGDFEVGDHKGRVAAGDVVVVPAGSQHNFVNTGASAMKLYTVYAPPEHPDGTVHKTKAEADAAEAAEHGHGGGGYQAPSGLTVGSLLGK